MVSNYKTCADKMNNLIKEMAQMEAVLDNRTNFSITGEFAYKIMYDNTILLELRLKALLLHKTCINKIKEVDANMKVKSPPVKPTTKKKS